MKSPNMQLLTTVVLYLNLMTAIRTQPFTSGDLDFVKLVHRSFCGANSLCTSPGNAMTGTDSTTRRIGDLPYPPPDGIDPFCCNPCSCDLNTCNDFGTCCPDILDKLPTVEESSIPRKAVCGTTTLKTTGFFSKYWLYVSCSDGFQVNDAKDMETKSKCENRTDYDDIKSLRPVYDLVSDRTFANSYCAICNGVNESTTVPWLMKLTCYEGAEFGKPLAIDTLVKNVLDTVNCDLEFHWPLKGNESYKYPSCRIWRTQCNMTGDWVQYDPVIEAACHAYRASYDYRYHNVFCSLCNEKKGKRWCSDNSQGNIGRISFSAVLDFNRGFVPETEVSTLCLDTQIYDYYKKVCRDLSCSYLRVLQGGACLNVGEDVIEVAYRFQLKFQIIDVYEINQIGYIVPLIRDYVEDLLNTWVSLNATLTSTLYYKFSFKPLDDRQFESATMSLPIPDDVDISTGRRTTTTQTILAVDYILWEVTWYFKLNTVKPHSADFLDNVLRIDKTTTTLYNSQSGLSVHIHLSVVDFPLGEFSNPLDPSTGESLSTFPILMNLPDPLYLLPITPQVQTLDQTLICPLVQINTSEYFIQETLKGMYVEELNFTFDRLSYFRDTSRQNESVYSVCKDTFISVTSVFGLSLTTAKPTPVESDVTPQGVLSVVCACISIVCALLTLLTYGLFSELRTQPGINNMSLCINLIFAQAFFTFASPHNDILSQNVCSFFGALIHFFWLMVVFAMNVCCYHMVMVFIGQSANRSKAAASRIKTALYTVYCVVASLFFVSINIIVVVVDTENSENGYGRGICYISRSKMVGYAFALPLGLVLMINLVSFVAVVIKISRSPTVNSSMKNDRNYFKIYAKLSTVTGLTWIFGFMFEFTNQTVFEYFFIILNAGIGVLIFLSFVCNKRIYGLYKGLILKIGTKKDTTNGKSSQEKAIQLHSASTESRNQTDV